MSAECPPATPAVGEHQVQHESTDCWEFALVPQTSSCLVQLSGDAAWERSNGIGQNRTPQNQNRWKKWPTQRGLLLLNWRCVRIQVTDCLLWSTTGSTVESLNGLNRHRPGGPEGSGAPWIRAKWTVSTTTRLMKCSRAHAVISFMQSCVSQRGEPPSKRVNCRALRY